MSEPRYTLQDLNQVPARTIEDRDDRDSWLPLNLAYLPEEPPVKPTLGGFGIVYPGKRHVFSGPQESAKTLAAYAIVLETVRATSSSCVVLDFEMGAYAARTRLRELGATPDDFERIHYLEPHEPASDERIGTLIALQPMIVLIDAAAGAYDLQGLDENKRADVERFTRLYVRGFWKAGIATIVLDHVVKNTETRGKYAIGSERKTGGVDVHLGFDTILPIKRGSTGLYKITTHKDRDGYLQRGQLAELHLSSEAETHRIRWEFRPAEHVEPGETWMPTKVMQKISGLLEAKPEPVSRNAIVTEAGGKREVAVTAIDHLVRLGYVTETAGPRQAKLLESTRPFTVLEWESKDNDPLVPTCSPLVPGTSQDEEQNDLFPLVPDLSPEQVHPLVPPHPFRGGAREQVDAAQNNSLVPDLGSWIDDLEPEPRDHPPADLHETSDDDIPGL